MSCLLRLVCNDLDLTIDHPVNYSRSEVLARGIEETLGLRSLSDTTGRKYTYKMSWGGLPKTDYEDLNDIFVEHLDSETPVTLYFDRFDSANGVLCNMSIGEMKPKGLLTEYLVEFEIELTEINSR